jgi:hypothetical protein
MQKHYPALPPWLDRETTLLVDEIVDLLVKRHPDILAIMRNSCSRGVSL